MKNNILSAKIKTNLELDNIIWENIRHPLRSIETRAFLKKKPEWFLSARGDLKETPLHWAVLTEIGLVLEEIETGLDINAVDSLGRTPLDWLNDFLASAFLRKDSKITEQGKQNLLDRTENIGLILLSQGGITGNSINSFHPGRIWMLCGAWNLLGSYGLLKNYSYNNWTNEGAGALHSWVIAPQSKYKNDWLNDYLTNNNDVNPLDQENRNPLWYAIDAIASKLELKKEISLAYHELIAKGGDPTIKDLNGYSALDLLKLYNINL
jgi:ankyrin repeat protein